MKRIGIFSGKIYDYDAKDIKECSVIINDTDAANPEVVKRKHDSYKNKCVGCGRCPMSLEAVGIKYSIYTDTIGMDIELVLKELIPAAHIAGLMQANGKINIENDDDLTEFIVNHFVEWCTTDKKVSFEEYATKKLIAKYRPTNEEV